MATPECPHCAQMQSRLEAALRERDVALLQLARTREELNLRSLGDKWAAEEPVPSYPVEAGVALPVPLRYRVADTLNTWAKRAAPRLQRWTRTLSGKHHER